MSPTIDLSKPPKETLRKIQMLRTTTIARHVVGETPGPQIRDVWAKDSMHDDVGNSLAISLVRHGNAKFTSEKEQKEFLESERNRMENGVYLNDRELKAFMKSQDIVVQQLA